MTGQGARSCETRWEALMIVAQVKEGGALLGVVGGEREREHLDDSRHVLEELRELGDWVDIWVWGLKDKDVSRIILSFFNWVGGGAIY